MGKKLIKFTLIGSSLLLAGFWLVPRRSKLIVTEEKRFPTVSGNNLNRVELQFPQDFLGELNIVFIPFYQEQQLDVNSWIPYARQLEAEYDHVAHYEFPTIYEMAALSRTFLNEGMRAGIPDPIARERTVTLYLDVTKFTEAVGIEDRSEIHTLLVTKEGKIIWHQLGRLDEAKADSLKDTIEQYNIEKQN